MKKINHIDSIRNPIITEKATILSEQNKTVFKVHNKANKKTIKKNIEKLFKVSVIKVNIINRKAKFKTVIALILNNKEYYFEGFVKGGILKEKRGTGGFGYDPIFKPNGYDETFAQMSIELKNKISHRGLAVKKLVAFLNQEASGL